MLGMLKGLWQYRHFVLSSIRNDLVSRFSRSKFGGLWMIINPLAQVAIYALILSNVLAAKIPGIEDKYSYAIHLMAGLLAFMLFSEIINGCLNLFISQGNLMKKMSFPRITLPAVVVGSGLLNNALLFIAMVGVFLLLGHQFTFDMLWLIPLTLLLAVFALGIGLIAGVINVFLRDVGQALPIVLQMWFWLTPIVYPITIIPEEHRHWFDLNPLYPIVDAYHQVLLYGKSPDVSALLGVSIASLILVGLALFVFRRASEEMVDAL
ncbi:ABC transporter permease [Spiribacter sp. 221]|uniref:ABC transporter permease n=1 Tax=Spiribacter onubensis TaxID=3122420 RepID=UPI00349F3D81